MIGLVNPRAPSENIFVKDPIQSIEEFLSKYCSHANDTRKGITLDLDAWVKLDLIYE